MGKIRYHYYQILLVFEKRQYNATQWHCTANACSVLLYFNGLYCCHLRSRSMRIHHLLLLAQICRPSNFLFSFISTPPLVFVCTSTITSTMRHWHSINPATVSSLHRYYPRNWVSHPPITEIARRAPAGPRRQNRAGARGERSRPHRAKILNQPDVAEGCGFDVYLYPPPLSTPSSLSSPSCA